MKKAIKSFVSKQFGFKATNVIPLECSVKDMKFEYVMFEVCGIEYQAKLSNGSWDLTIYTI